jgi:hypothetical protein
MLISVVATIGLCGGNAKADFAFGEPMNLGPTINTSSDEWPVCISADGLEMYISSDSDGDPDLWVIKRASTDDSWGPPENLGPPINSNENQEASAHISPDGKTLYFDSDRGGIWGIWVSKRQTKDAPWEAPVNLGPPVNSQYNGGAPCVSADGLELYFGSYRPGGQGELDIWLATRSSVEDPWSEPENLSILNGAGYEFYMSLSPDGLVLFLDSDSEHPGGFGGSDAWMSRRISKNDPWTAPVNLGPPVNSPYNDGNPVVSPDGRMLYFGSSRPGGLGGGDADIWQAPILPVVDLNGDGRVDGVEFTKLVDHWGQNASSCDIGPTALGDGIVDVEDMIILSEYIGKDVNDPSLMAHWALDEVEGNIAYDSAGRNDAEVMGEAAWQPSDGVVDGALLLDGVNDCLTTEYVRDPSDGPLSILAWVKGGAPGQVVVSQILGANWLMTDSFTGYLMTDLKPPGRSGKVLVSDVVITDGNWHRVGLVWDGINRILYVDDIMVATDTPSELVGSNGGLNIGCGKNLESGTFWSGLIDDVRFYSRAVKP